MDIGLEWKDDHHDDIASQYSTANPASDVRLLLSY
jgi:hypothetical protein